MTLFHRSKPKVVKQVRPIGQARGLKYVAVDGGEYIEAGEVLTQDEAGPDDVLLQVTERAHDDRGHSMPVGVRFRRLLPVPNGTFEQERSKGYRPRTDHRLVDALDLPVLAARQPMIFAGANSAYAGGRPAIRGRDLVTFLESQGVSVSVHAGRLLVSATAGHLTADLRQVVEVAERLLVGFLTKSPALCELPHKGRPEEAWTVLVGGGILACVDHATGEVPSNA